jgi:hypothetical protein
MKRLKCKIAVEVQICWVRIEKREKFAFNVEELLKIFVLIMVSHSIHDSPATFCLLVNHASAQERRPLKITVIT